MLSVILPKLICMQKFFFIDRIRVNFNSVSRQILKLVKCKYKFHSYSFLHPYHPYYHYSHPESTSTLGVKNPIAISTLIHGLHPILL